MIEIKIADNEHEFEQIHRLNYTTFVEEIPQHEGNSQLLLVDKFHRINTYIIAKENNEVIGMLAYNRIRPFSLDSKLSKLEHYLPAFEKPIEIRLLAISRQKRKSLVFSGLLKKLAEQLQHNEFDIILISGTTRQLELYHKIGFVDFAHLTGNGEALYQPMYLTKNNIQPQYMHQWLKRSTLPQDL